MLLQVAKANIKSVCCAARTIGGWSGLGGSDGAMRVKCNC